MLIIKEDEEEEESREVFSFSKGDLSKLVHINNMQ
jgi:hypothetical protein